ncbi:unnamed protein product, partial [Ectocarpus sp. 12 AP-2014]
FCFVADPPGDCLRIRLVVAVLEGCGSYFVRGAGLDKLCKFLGVFQRYSSTVVVVHID